MTENEAIKQLQVGYLGDTEDLVQAKHIAIKALKEIQQYRAIGTVEELKVLKEVRGNCKECAGCTAWKCDCFNERTYAIDEFVSTLVPRLTDAIYQKDVESMTNLINGVAEELKAGVEDE